MAEKTRVLDTTLTIVLIVTTLIIGITVLRREWAPQSPQNAGSSRRISDWSGLVRDGVPITMIGDSAKVDVIVFSDLQCPFCAQFHEEVLPEVEREFGQAVGVTFLHFPLPNHRYAQQAAHAAECAGAQARFRAFLDVAFANQDSIGSVPWWSFAKQASVADSTKFVHCLEGPQPGRVLDNMRLARTLQLTGTPTVIVDGRVLRGPTLDAVIGAIEEALAN